MTVIQDTHPRWRRNSIGETAKDAAQGVAPRAQTLRQLTLDMIEAGPATGEAVYAKLSEQGVRCVLYSIKPRLSELARQGLVKDSGVRGLSDSGKCRSIVWVATSPEEREAFKVAQARAARPEEAEPAKSRWDWTPIEPVPTPEQIVASMTPRGAWTRATLGSWGVPWPPPRGWRARLERLFREAAETRACEAERAVA